MKKIVFVAGLFLLMAASCSKETVNEVINNTPEVADRDTLVPVHVHVNDFSIIQEDFPETRSNPQTPTASGVKAMTLAFYNGDTEVYKTTQLKDDATQTNTFGEFECALPKGTYTMVVLGYGYFEGDVLTLTSPTQAAYTSNRPRETFAATEAVNITTTQAVEVSTTLSRIVSRLQIVSTDGRTDDAANVRVTFSAGGKAFLLRRWKGIQPHHGPGNSQYWIQQYIECHRECRHQIQLHRLPLPQYRRADHGRHHRRTQHRRHFNIPQRAQRRALQAQPQHQNHWCPV